MLKNNFFLTLVLKIFVLKKNYDTKKERKMSDFKKVPDALLNEIMSYLPTLKQFRKTQKVIDEVKIDFYNKLKLFEENLPLKLIINDLYLNHNKMIIIREYLPAIELFWMSGQYLNVFERVMTDSFTFYIRDSDFQKQLRGVLTRMIDLNYNNWNNNKLGLRQFVLNIFYIDRRNREILKFLLFPDVFVDKDNIRDLIRNYILNPIRNGSIKYDDIYSLAVSSLLSLYNVPFLEIHYFLKEMLALKEQEIKLNKPKYWKHVNNKCLELDNDDYTGEMYIDEKTCLENKSSFIKPEDALVKEYTEGAYEFIIRGCLLVNNYGFIKEILKYKGGTYPNLKSIKLHDVF